MSDVMIFILFRKMRYILGYIVDLIFVLVSLLDLIYSVEGLLYICLIVVLFVRSPLLDYDK